MLKLRTMLLAVFALAALPFTAAFSFDAYKKDAFEAALKSGSPVIVHVHAEW